MSMKKILMAAAAVTALTAGVANAAVFTGVKVSGKTLQPFVSGTPATPATSFALANSVIATGTAATTNLTTTTTPADNTIKAKLSAGVFDPNAGGTNYSFTYTLSGTATPVFAQAITTATMIGMAGSCTAPAVTITGGGAVGTNYVQGVFNVPNTCSSTGTNLAPNEISIDAPFKISSAGTVNGTMAFKIVSTDAAYDGAGVTHPLVITADPYTIAVASSDKTTRFTLGTSAYSQLDGGTSYDKSIGLIAVKNADAPTSAAGSVVYANLQAATLPTIVADITTKAVNGTFSIVKPSLGISASSTAAYVVAGTAGQTLTVSSADPSTATKLAAPIGGYSVDVTIATSNKTSLGTAQSYTATVTPAFSTSNTLVSVPAAVTAAALETIGLEGLTFVAPWIGGSQSGTQSYVRVSNSGSATGLVTLNLLSPVYGTGTTAGATTCTSTQLPKLASVAAGGELVISPDDLTTCFGAFRRGDLSVTLQAASGSLTAKARNVTATTVSELSLGNGI